MKPLTVGSLFAGILLAALILGLRGPEWKSNGRIYSRAKWVFHIHDDGCSLWPTPRASMDGRGFGIPLHEHSGRYKRSTVLRIQELVTSHGWRIHPNFTEALMGFPMDHSAIVASVTPSVRTARNGSGVALSKQKQKRKRDE